MKSIPYRISRIETAQFALFPDKYVNGEEVMVNTNLTFNYNNDLSLIRNILTINYSQGENLLLILQLNCYFNILPEGTETIKAEGYISVDFMRYMGTISVGTARGVIHAKTESTVLNAIVLPPINLVEVLKEDLQLKKNE